MYGGSFKIGPGGKSRNVAEMIGVLVDEPYSVAMIGKTVEDKQGIWKVPVDALEVVKVDTSHIQVLKGDGIKTPAVALLIVTKAGVNAAHIFEGVSNEFSPEDIDKADELFQTAKNNKGILALSLECPLSTAKYAIDKASALGLKVILDPGGIEAQGNVDDILTKNIYMIKPNEYEAKILTGIDITDIDSAREAAHSLMNRGIKNVLITVGSKGAYLFSEGIEKHIEIPNIPSTDQKDDTGCGDQTMAALCYYIKDGKSLEEASKLAILAGTLEFQKVGIQPITKSEIDQLI